MYIAQSLGALRDEELLLMLNDSVILQNVLSKLSSAESQSLIQRLEGMKARSNMAASSGQRQHAHPQGGRSVSFATPRMRSDSIGSQGQAGQSFAQSQHQRSPSLPFGNSPRMDPGSLPNASQSNFHGVNTLHPPLFSQAHATSSPSLGADGGFVIVKRGEPTEKRVKRIIGKLEEYPDEQRKLSIICLVSISKICWASRNCRSKAAYSYAAEDDR